MKQLFIYGSGNPEISRLALRINNVAQSWDRIAFLDDNPDLLNKQRWGLPIAGTIEMLSEMNLSDVECVVEISRSMEIRKNVIGKAMAHGVQFTSLIDPGVLVDDVQFGDDVIVYWGAQISPTVRIGAHTIICMGSVIAHECEIGECVFISPGAVLNSRIRVGEGTFIGANATIIPEISIGRGATVGAGAVVMQPVGDGETVVGNPARLIYKKQLK